MAEVFTSTESTAEGQTQEAEVTAQTTEQADEAQAQDEQQVADATAAEENQQPDEAEVDWKARADEQSKEIERLRRNLQTARRGERQNRNRGADEVETLRTELRDTQRQLAELLPDTDRQARLEQIAQAEREDGTRTVESIRNDVDGQIAALLAEHSLSTDDVKDLITDLTPMWRNINGANDGQMFYRLFERELERFQGTRTTTQQGRQAQQEQRAQEQRQNANRLAMGSTPSSPGGPPRATLDTIDSLYVTWGREHPGEPNPYTEDYRSVMKTGRLARR